MTFFSTLLAGTLLFQRPLSIYLVFDYVLSDHTKSLSPHSIQELLGLEGPLHEMQQLDFLHLAAPAQVRHDIMGNRCKHSTYRPLSLMLTISRNPRVWHCGHGLPSRHDNIRSGEKHETMHKRKYKFSCNDDCELLEQLHNVDKQVSKAVVFIADY